MKFFFLSSSNVHDDSLLIIPNVYAQEYNPTSDAYDNLINVLLPLLIISAYKSRYKYLIGIFEFCLLWIYLFIFPPIYNYFVYKSTYKYDFVCMISCIILSTCFVCLLAYGIKNNVTVIKSIDKPAKKPSRLIFTPKQYIISGLLLILICSIMPSLSFTYAIYWIRKDVIIEKITYGWYIFVSTIFILIVFLLMLFGRILLAFYFYLVVSIGLCFSIAYSSNSYFTKLVLVFMSYFLARVFDSEVLLGRFVKSYDKSAIVRDFFHAIHKCFGYFAKVDNTRMLRFYIDEADKAIDDMDIKFMVADDFSFKDVSEITIRYNINAPRSAHYIKNIRYSTSFLTIMVNDETMDYPLHGVQNNILFQTPKLLNGIILTMTFLKEENQ
ncbi:unnamed protein product [Rhizophagus irregularis]|nr:unnamed protein product [Rhizophagus irregularis]